VKRSYETTMYSQFHTNTYNVQLTALVFYHACKLLYSGRL